MYRHPPPLTLAANRLDGRVILVTGASSGIGAAAVRRFAAEGAKVAAAARRKDRLDELAGDTVIAVQCDVTDEDSVAASVATTVDAFGRLDGAFNAAGIGGSHRKVHEVDTETFDRVVETNLRGSFLCLKHQIPALLAAGGGSVVLTSSIGGLVGGSGNADYATTKFGLEGLLRCAALDYAADGIRVNAIAPGPTRSEMFDRWMPTEQHREQLAAIFPMNYIADPDDMARAALFLLSDESRWTTGTVLACEGGFSAG